MEVSGHFHTLTTSDTGKIHRYQFDKKLRLGGPRAGLDAVAERNVPPPDGNRTAIVQLVS
jgi:hypothetical protein